MLNNTAIRSFARKLKINHFRRNWVKLNKNNKTIPINLFPINNVVVGNETYGELNVISYNNSSKLKIGNFCSIASNVTFLLDAEHHFETISTYPFKNKILNLGDEAFSKGDIVVDDDVWIGHGVTILSGIHIRQGAVVAAGAVVSKDVPPYAIVGGVPAKVIKYRFSDDLIKELLKVDYSKLTKEIIQEHVDDLYTDLKDIKQLDWMPRKK